MTNEISCGIKNIPQLENYFTELKNSNKSVHTIRAYRQTMNKFVAHFNLEDISRINSLTMSDYREFISSLDMSPASKNGHIRNLSASLMWLEENEVISGCKLFSVKFGKGKLIKEGKKKRAILTDDESFKIITAGKNSQIKFMLGLMIWGGLRNDEVRSIKMEDIKDNELLVHGKGQKERSIAFNPVLEKFYLEYLKDRDSNSEYLFFSNHNPESKMTSKSIVDRIKKAYSDAGLSGKNITAHSLRRTSASNMIREHDIRSAQKFLGHSSINTTVLYDQNDSEYIKDIMKKTTKTFGF